jgi:hypothetical protein
MVEVPRSDVPGSTPGEPGASGLGTQARPGREDPGSGYSMYVEEGVSGWAWFTGGLMVLVGIFQFIAGITALAGSGYYTVPARNLVLDASYSTWGWVHLVVGIVAMVTGGGLAFGVTAARVVGVALAGLSAIVNFGFIPAAPFAATLIIGMDVFLIYAITVHGGEPKQAR